MPQNAIWPSPRPPERVIIALTRERSLPPDRVLVQPRRSASMNSTRVRRTRDLASSRLRANGKRSKLPRRRRCSGGCSIRPILLSVLFVLAPAAASAQFGPPGGFAPFLFSAPEAGAAASARPDPNPANGAGGGVSCYWESHGRGGGETQCAPNPAAPPKK
jgi:hypothetical protein